MIKDLNLIKYSNKALALANAGIEFSTPGGRSYHAKTWLISRVLCV